jgi:N6-adenosine-specific RNA methylase IME4
MEGDLFARFPASGKFSVIYADPPWKYSAPPPRAGHAHAAKIYRCLSRKQLEMLPVASLAADDCVLLLWSTVTHLEQALHLMRHWGFDYRGIFINWVKLTKRGNPHSMPGPYSRCGSELLLLGMKGRARSVLRPKVKSKQQVLMAPVGKHSAKPALVRDRIDEIFAGQKIELFARDAPERKDWHYWGDQCQE